MLSPSSAPRCFLNPQLSTLTFPEFPFRRNRSARLRVSFSSAGEFGPSKISESTDQHCSMNKRRQLQKLAELERESQKIREDLKISRPNEVLYRAPQSTWSDNDIVVEAGGQGDARLLIVEGNYPIDYLIKSERVFASELEACEAANALTR